MIISLRIRNGKVANNKVISDLVDFTKTFFSKHTILNVLTKYCVFTSEDLLLVMRPYQIAATERILSRIEISTNYKKLGTIDAGGYIWHTTGSGKTLTSFKTAQLATRLEYIPIFADNAGSGKHYNLRTTPQVFGGEPDIDAAKLYYMEFQKQMKEATEARRLRIATIFSYGVNEEVTDDFVEDENSENTDGLDQSSRDFLDMAIGDYNEMFKTNYDTSSDKFQNYYKDVSLRMKNREIDILIVVNMFLTGFDATTLNTLWVDKNLKYHGLIQAFSRTNRILNSVKTFGNIVCFRNLEDETNKAIALFGDKDAGSIVLLKSFEAYYNGYDEDGKHYDGYVELVDKLQQMFPVGQSIIREEAQKEFIKLFGAILRVKNILTSFNNFVGQEILTSRDFQDYQSEYIDLYQQFKPKGDEKKENINDDIEFEIELIKQVEINIDYILLLVKKYQEDGDKDKSE